MSEMTREDRGRRWNRASGTLFALAGAIVMVYGLIYMVTAGTQEPTPEITRGDVELISMQGEPVDLLRHLAPGKYTVVDFYAEWCPPCQEIGPFLENLAATQDRLAVRKINIEHWGTPVVAQYGVEEFGLPYLRIYGPDGSMIAEGLDPVLEEIQRRF
jgi:thiol-disulfide isomerase/thioredoxin